MGHLTFVSKRLSAVGNKRISQFFDSARAPPSRVIALVDSTWVFLLLSFLTRGYAKRRNGFLLGLRYANVSLAHSGVESS